MTNLERLIFYYGAGRLFIPWPRYFIYNATLRCDLSCRHCGVWQARKRDELGAAEIEKILKRNFFAKVETAWLTGGEPSLRKDLPEIAKVFRKCFPALTTFGIASNGFATERIMTGLEGIMSELDSTRQQLFVHLSLDGIGEVHDKIRGKAGAFAGLTATIEAIRSFQDKNPGRKIEFGFNCVIQPDNIGQLNEIRAFARNYSASLTFNLVEITDQYYSNQDRSAELALDGPARQTVIQFLRELAEESAPAFGYQYRRFLAVLEGRRRDRRCLSLYSTFVIDADGSWIPCPLSSDWKRVNFQTTDPAVFWKSGEANEVRRRAAREQCPDCMLSCSLGDSISLYEFLSGGF